MFTSLCILCYVFQIDYVSCLLPSGFLVVLGNDSYCSDRGCENREADGLHHRQVRCALCVRGGDPPQFRTPPRGPSLIPVPPPFTCCYVACYVAVARLPWQPSPRPVFLDHHFPPRFQPVLCAPQRLSHVRAIERSQRIIFDIVNCKSTAYLSGVNVCRWTLHFVDFLTAFKDELCWRIIKYFKRISVLLWIVIVISVLIWFVEESCVVVLPLDF